MSTLAPESSTISRITLPPLPMTSRILSLGTFKDSILGAYLENSDVFDKDLPNQPFEKINKEDLITISGKIFDGENKPLLDVMIETWQCDQNGIFNKEKGFSRIIPDINTGLFRLITLKPGFSKNINDKFQSPHILFWIVARGMNQPLITRMYFEDEELEKDNLFRLVKDKKRIHTLLAKKNNEKEYKFNIYLQGEEETIFFDF